MNTLTMGILAVAAAVALLQRASGALFLAAFPSMNLLDDACFQILLRL